MHSKPEKAVNKDMPYVTVKPFSKVDFNKIGLDENELNEMREHLLSSGKED